MKENFVAGKRNLCESELSTLLKINIHRLISIWNVRS